MYVSTVCRAWQSFRFIEPNKRNRAREVAQLLTWPYTEDSQKKKPASLFVAAIFNFPETTSTGGVYEWVYVWTISVRRRQWATRHIIFRFILAEVCVLQ